MLKRMTMSMLAVIYGVWTVNVDIYVDSIAMCNEYPKRWFRYFVATWAFLETFLLAGYKAGWASLVYVLKKEGIYRSLCHGSSQRYVNNTTPIHAIMTFRRYFGVVDNTTYGQYGDSWNFTLEGTKILQDEDTGCADQDAMFELCVSISSVLSTFLSLLISQINFAYGIRTTRLLSIYVVTAWAFLETFLLSGYYAGWASLVYILKKEGIYRFLCKGLPQRYANYTTPIHNDFTNRRELDLIEGYNVSVGFTSEHSVTGCTDQDAVFELCVAICSVLSPFITLLMGHINFVYGIRTTRIICITLLVIGSTMFAVISVDTPWLMFIGYMALGNGGMGILQTNNQVSYMFAKGGPTVIGLICGAFDASAAVMLGVKLAYDHGVSLQMSFIVIGCLNMLVVISTFSFLPKKFIKNTQTDSTIGADHKAVLSEESKHASAKDNNNRQMSERTILLSGALLELRSGVSEPHTGTDAIPTDEERNRVSMNGEEPRMEEDKETSRNSRLLGYIFSPLYLLTLLWTCVIQLLFVLFICSLNAWLEHITHGVEERVSFLTDFMFSAMLASPVVSILSGGMVDFLYSIQPETRSHKARTHNALAVPIVLTNVLAVILCACVVVEREDMTYITAITSVLYRTLLYSGLTLFTRLLYPSDYFAALYGVMFMISGFASFLQYPLFLWCQSSPSGYRQVYSMLGLTCILILVQPIYLVYTGRREK